MRRTLDEIPEVEKQALREHWEAKTLSERREGCRKAKLALLEVEKQMTLALMMSMQPDKVDPETCFAEFAEFKGELQELVDELREANDILGEMANDIGMQDVLEQFGSLPKVLNRVYPPMPPRLRLIRTPIAMRPIVRARPRSPRSRVLRLVKTGTSAVSGAGDGPPEPPSRAPDGGSSGLGVVPPDSSWRRS